MSEPLLLPAPRRCRERFAFPVPLYGDDAVLYLPRDMTAAEAAKIARAVIAMGACTSYHPSRP